MKHRLTIILSMGLLSLILMQSGQASEAFSITGYSKAFTVANRYPEWKKPDSIPNPPNLNWVSNHARFNAIWRTAQWLTVHGSYDITPRMMHRTKLLPYLTFSSIDPLSYRAVDFDPRLYPSMNERVRDFTLYHNLDRLHADVRMPFADLILGRQAIAWGTARIVNPTDIIAPYTYDALDTEDRIGVDAVRLRVPIGFMGEIDAGYVFGEDAEWDNSAVFLRAKYYLWKTDISALTVAFRNNAMVGIDMARAIGGAGFWAEGAYVALDAFADCDRGYDDYIRFSTGMDYCFSDRLYGFIEYHYNGAGAEQPEDYITNMDHPAYTEGAIYLMGRHYLAPGITFQITPLIMLYTQVLCNLTDPSAYLAPSAEYNLMENAYLSGGMYLGFGKTPQFDFRSLDDYTITMRSEFRGYPNTFFVNLKVYF